MSISWQNAVSQPERLGSELVCEILHSEGVRHVFGNPGTTELPIIQALGNRRDISYVLALQETSVVAMADGYAQASGRVGVANLHTAGGLGHAMGAILSAQTARTPLVITAGQQDMRHIATDPLLSGDLVNIARPAVKWAREITHPEQIPILMRRAFNDSKAAPSGPVFLSLPINIMETATSVGAGHRSHVEYRSVTTAIDELAKRIRAFSPGRLALIVGDEVFASTAGEQIVELAEALGAPVLGASWPGHIPFPTAHPLWRGPLPTQAFDVRARLTSYDGIFILGGDSIITYLYTEGPAVPPGCEILQLSAVAGDLGRTYPTTFACVGDLRSSLEALLPLLRDGKQDVAVIAAYEQAQLNQEKERAELLRQLDAGLLASTISPFVAAGEIARALGADTPVIDEAPATMSFLRQFLRSRSYKQYNFMRSAILGWGMPAAVGTSIGLDRQPVVAVIGDGSAMYSPQSLWTAAHEKLPATFVIVNNQGYGILKNVMKKTVAADDNSSRNYFVGMDLVQPPIDFVALAKTFGLPARRVGNASEIADAIQAGIASGIPNLVEIPVSFP